MTGGSATAVRRRSFRMASTGWAWMSQPSGTRWKVRTCLSWSVTTPTVPAIARPCGRASIDGVQR